VFLKKARKNNKKKKNKKQTNKKTITIIEKKNYCKEQVIVDFLEGIKEGN